MKTSKILKAIAMLFGLAIGASSCHDLKGDNSDFDFGYADTESATIPNIPLPQPTSATRLQLKSSDCISSTHIDVVS